MNTYGRTEEEQREVDEMLARFDRERAEREARTAHLHAELKALGIDLDKPAPKPGAPNTRTRYFDGGKTAVTEYVR